jgi:CheY-like chemotaxis protein
MSARGIDFFESWVHRNIREPGQSGDWAKARELAKELRVDAAAAGFTVADLILEKGRIEKYIYDHMTGGLNRPIRRIVIIDDLPAFAQTLSEMMESLGYQVRVSTDARSSFTFDLEDDDIVFVDVLMPHVSGFQVLEQLARQKAKSWIVLMSGDKERLDAAEKLAEQLELNLIGALEKPFKLADIQVALAGT